MRLRVGKRKWVWFTSPSLRNGFSFTFRLSRSATNVEVLACHRQFFAGTWR